MDEITILHRTTYRYRSPVRLNPHRMVVRPRESRELRLLSIDVTITPAASLSWSYDVFGNAVAIASFESATDLLTIESVAKIELDAPAWPIFDVAASAIQYRFPIPTMSGWISVR
ncbi:hypothetical protein METY_3070 [Methylopila sp. Yamaguchi]|nr:hypothetical protein METY_3070 [Methylopila sp. Yamaguchi]